MGAMFGKTDINPLHAKAYLDPLGMFDKPVKPGDPIIPPPAPTLGNTQGEGDVAAQQQALAAQRGRSATLLTGGSGLSNLGTTSSTSKMLFGQ